MPEVNEAKAQAATDCFAFNPTMNTVFVTSGPACFADRNAAVNHARKLDDKDIDVFIREQGEAVADVDQSNNVSAESAIIPNFQIAQAKKAANAGIEFAKIETPPIVATDADAQYAAAKPLFSELYIKWNAMPLDQQDTEDGKQLHDQLSKLYEVITKYEAVNTPAADAGTPGANPVIDPAADKSVVIAKLDEIVETVEHLLGIDKAAE